MMQVMLFVQLSSPALQFVKAGHIRSCLCQIFPHSRWGPDSWPHWFKGRIQQLLCKVLHTIPRQRLAQVQLEGFELESENYKSRDPTVRSSHVKNLLEVINLDLTTLSFKTTASLRPFAEPDSSNSYFWKKGPECTCQLEMVLFDFFELKCMENKEHDFVGINDPMKAVRCQQQSRARKHLEP